MKITFTQPGFTRKLKKFSLILVLLSAFAGMTRAEAGNAFSHFKPEAISARTLVIDGVLNRGDENGYTSNKYLSTRGVISLGEVAKPAIHRVLSGAAEAVKPAERAPNKASASGNPVPADRGPADRNPSFDASKINYIASLLAPHIESFSPKRGHVGSQFKITGTNLSNLTALRIGGNSVIVLSNNGTELIGMVTPKTRTGNISVVTENGMTRSAGTFSITSAQNYTSGGLMRNSQGNMGWEGTSIAVSGDGNTMVSGVPQYNTYQGGFVVYVNNGGSWVQQGGFIQSSPLVTYEQLGMSLSISSDGNTVIAGTFGRNSNNLGAAAFIFTRTGTTWSQQGAVLKPKDSVNSNVGTGFGQAVSLSSDGNTAAIGGQYDNYTGSTSTYAGAVWIFKRAAGIWTQQGNKLTVATTGTQTLFGSSVALSGDGNTVFGGSYQDASGIGGTWVFTQSGGVWTQQGSKLLGSGTVGAANQGYSIASSYDGNTLVMGGPSDNSSTGTAWVFNRVGSTWSQNGSKLALTGIVGYLQNNSYAGSSAGNLNEVAMSGDGTVLAVSAVQDNNGTGAFWVFTLSAGAWTIHGSKITNGTNFASAVSLNYDGSVLAVGASGYNNNQFGGSFIYATPIVTPTTQSTNLVFTNTLGSSTTASWTNGNGNKHAVFMSLATSGSPAPVNATAYVAAAYGSGTTAGAGWYCVYNGTASTASITGLSITTTYRVMTVDYNGPTGGQLYYTPIATGNPGSVTTQTPTISSTGSLSALSTIFGTASSTGTFSVSGQALSAGILVTAPAGYEVSQNSGTGFTGTTTVGSSGTVASTPVYIRLAALSGVAGSPYSGNVVLSSTGVTSVNVATVASTVAKAALTLTANNVSKVYGATLTGASGSAAFTNSALQNADVINSVTIAYGTGAAPTIAVGTQTGVVTPSLPVASSGTFLAGNYTITPVAGNITIAKSPLTVVVTGPLKGYGTALTQTTSSVNFTPVTGVNSEAVTSITISPDGPGQLATTAVGAAYSVAGSLATGSGGFLESNYQMTYTPYAGTVTQASITINVLAQPKVYGTTQPSGATTNSAYFSVTGTMASGESISGFTLVPTGTASSTTLAAGSAYSIGGSTPVGSGSTFIASNYTIVFNPYNGTVTGAPLTVTALGPLKIYGTSLTGAATGNTALFSYSGTIGSETVTSVTLTPDASGQSATRAAGLGYTVTPSAPTGANSFLASNYVLTPINYAGTVSPATMTVTVSGPLKSYGTILGTTTGTANFTASAGVNSEALTSLTLTPNAAGTSGTTAVGQPYTVTGSAYTGTGGFLASNYTITPPIYTGTVTQGLLTITVSGPQKAYGTAITSTATTVPANFSLTSGTVAAGETLTGFTLAPDAAASSTSTPAGTVYHVGGVTGSAIGTGTFSATNYTINFISYTGTVSKVNLTYTATGQPKPYGTVLTGGAVTNTAWFTVSGLITGDQVTGVTLTPDGPGQLSSTAVGATYVVSPSAPTGSGNFLISNYTPIPVNYTGTVTLAPLTITALGQTRNYGAALSPLTTTNTALFSYTGIAPNEAITGITLTPNTAGSTASTPAGQAYIVVPSAPTGTGGFLLSNYSPTYNQYNGTVGKVPMTLVATGPSKTYGNALAQGTFGPAFFTAAGMNSGETVTSVTLTPNPAALAANTSNTNSYLMTPSLATGGGGYLESNYAVAYTPYTGTVGPAAMSVTPTGPAKPYGTALGTTIVTTGFTYTVAANSEVVTGVTLNPDAAGQSATTAQGSAYTIRPTAATGNNGFLASNYTMNYLPYTGTVGVATLTLTATGPGRIYGTGLGTTTTGSLFTATGLLNGDQVTGVTLTPDANGANAALAQGSSYSVSPSLPTGNASFNAANYHVVIVPYTGTVSPLALVITATGPNKNYHTALTVGSSTTGFTTSAMANGDQILSITLTPNAPGLSANTAAGIAYVVAPTAAVGNGSYLASNYALSYLNFTGTVAPVVLTVTPTGPAKTYGTALAITTGLTSSFTATGLISGETITGLTLTPNAAGISASTAVNASYVITPTAATGTGGFLASNYVMNYLPFSGVVTPGLLTVTATGPLKTYGLALTAGTSTSSFSSVGLAAGETITSVMLTPDNAGLSASTPNSAHYVVAPTAATGANGFLASNYTISYVNYTGTVGSNALTITATSPVKKYGTPLTAGPSSINFTTSGTLPGETVTSVTLTPDANGLSSTTATGTTFNIVPTAATGTGTFQASNYTITYVNYTGAVIAAPMSIVASGPAKPYGTALSAATSTTTAFSASGAVAGDVITGVTLNANAAGQAAASPAGSTYLVTASAPTGNGSFLASNYIFTYPPYTGTVTKVPLTVTATALTKPYGTGLIAGTNTAHFSATGMVNSETVTGLTLTPDGPGLAASTPAGNAYQITPTLATGAAGFLESNYAVNYIPYTGHVNALALLITATGTTKVYGTSLSPVSSTTNFTATGTVGTDAVTSVTLSPDAAGISASTPFNSGFVMSPSLPVGNSSFLAGNYIISYAAFTGLVSQAQLSLAATGPLKTYGTGLSAGTSTSSFTATGAAPGETVTSVTLTPDAAGISTTTLTGASYSVAPSAPTGTGGFLASNYIVTPSNYAGTVGSIALTITATALPKTYGQVLSTGPGTNFTTSGTLPGQTVTSVTITPDNIGTSATAGTGSTYKLQPTAATGTGNFLASNYSITYLPYSGLVTQAPLIVTATGSHKSYGQVLAQTTAGPTLFTTSGTMNGEVVNAVTLTPDPAGASASTANGASYLETPSAPTSTGSFNINNYSPTYVPYNGTVSAATVTVTALAQAKVFGSVVPSGVTANTALFTASGMSGAELVTGVTMTANPAAAAAGTAYNQGFSIRPSAATGTGGFLASNYNMLYVDYSGLVGQAPLILTATGPLKVYGTGLTTATSTNNFTSAGLVNNDLITGVTLTPNTAGSTVTTAANAVYSVLPSLPTGSGSFLASNYAITYNPYPGTVSLAPITVTATGPAKPFGTALTAITTNTNFTATAGVNGEVVTGVNLTPDGPGMATNTPKSAAYIVVPSAATGTGGFSASNYAINYLPFSGIVSANVLTITATGPGRIYGTPLTAGTTTTGFTVSGLINGDQVTGITLTPDQNGATATTPAGTAYVMTPSAPTGNASFLASNYTVNYIPYTAGVVSKLDLTIAATSPARIYHSALTTGPSTVNFTTAGLAPGDVVSSVTLTPDAAGLSASTAAGAAYVVTPSAATGNPNFLTSNYNLHYIPFTGAVGTSIVTVTATGPSKSYGTVLTTTTGAGNFTAVGMVAGETVTGMTLTPDVNGASETTPYQGIYTVAATAATGAGGFLASNYTVNYVPFTGVVSQQALTITATGPLKVYGAGLSTTTSTSSFISAGLATGETISSVTLTPDAPGISTGTANGAAYSVMPSAAAGANGFLPSNYSITYLPYNGIVGTLNLIITATNPLKTFGEPLAAGASSTGFTVSGTLPGETVTSVTLTPNAAGLSATTPATANYAVTPTAATGIGGFLASNYNVTYTPYTGAVIAAPMSILATSPAKPYGTALAAAISTTGFTVSGLLAGDLVTGVTLTPDAPGLSASTAVGLAYQVTPSSATGNSTFLPANYAIVYLPYTAHVSAIPLTVTATGPNKPYGTSLSAATTTTNFTATGMATGELVGTITLTPDAAGISAATPSGAPYIMTPTAATGTGGFLASNYTVNYVPFTGHVNALAMTITATGTTKLYGQALSSVVTTGDFTTSGAIGGDQVTGITLNPDAPGQLATTAAGQPFVMTPSLPTGNSSFIAANYNITYVGFTGHVAQAPLVVNATGPLRKYGTGLTTGTSPANFTALGAIQGESVSSVTLTPDAAGQSSATVNGAPYTVSATAATGTGSFNISNYAVIYNPYDGFVGTAALTITATGPAITYGTSIPTGVSASFIASGTFSGETITSVTMTPNTNGSSGTASAGSSYSVQPSAATGTNGFVATNYSVTYLPYTATITPAPLAITASGPLKSYGVGLATASNTLDFSSAGIMNGDLISSVTMTPDAAGSSTSTAKGAPYVMTPSVPLGNSTFLPANYNITYNPYHGVVTAASVTIVLNGITKTFGQQLSATTGGSNFTATGMAVGEAVTGITLTPDAAGLSATTPYNAGYIIQASAATGTGGFLASNYTMVYTPFNAQVLKAPLRVVATGPSKIYGQVLAGAASTTNFIATGMEGNDLVTGITLTPDLSGTTNNSPAYTNYVVTPSLATGNGSFAATNYAISYIPFTGTVGQAALTVSATGPVKPFGTALAIGTTTTDFTSSGAISGEVATGVTLSPDGPGQAPNSPKGSAYTVIPSLVTGTGGFNAANYAVNYQPYTGTVAGTVLTITATGPGRIYGTALTAISSANNFTVSGLINGDLITGVTLTPDANGGNSSAPNGAAYSMTPSAATGNGSFLATNYTVHYIPYNGTISPLALTVVATGPAKTYHTALTAGSSTTDFVTSGLATGETISSVTLTPDSWGLSASTAAGTAYVVTPSAATGNNAFIASNYLITYTPFSGIVTTPVLTITATGPAKSYGTVLSTATSTSNFTAAGMVGGETVTGLTLTPDGAGASATTATGASYMVTPSAATGAGGFVASNYRVTYIPFTGVVSAQALTVTATGPLKRYGIALAAGTSTSSFTSAGLAPGETISSVYLTPDAAGHSTTASTGSTYMVAATAATGANGFVPSNYTITYIPYSGTIGNQDLTITATSPAKIYGSALITGAAGSGFVVSGTFPGETVTSMTLTPNAAGLATTTAAGAMYTVTPTAATGTGGFLASNYNVTYVPYSGAVGQAPLSILATGPGKNYGTALAGIATSNPAYFTASGTVLNDQVTGVTLSPDASAQSVTSAANSTYQVVPSAPLGNSSFVAANYAITYLPYTGTINAIPLTVVATGPNKPFGTALVTSVSSSNFTANGMAGGELVTGVTLTPDAAGLSATTAAGTSYTVAPSAATGSGGFLASNYVVTYIPFSKQVNPLNLVITATGPSKSYGTALNAAYSSTNFTATGAVGGDMVTGVMLTPDMNGTSVYRASGLSYLITPSAPVGNSSFIASNYNITYAGFTGTVNQALLTLDATGPLKKYGVGLTAGSSTGSFIATGLLNNEVISSVTLTPDAAGISLTTPTGSGYSVVPSAPQGTNGFLAANYNISYGTFHGTVDSKVLIITALSPAKTYGTALSAMASGTGYSVSGTYPGEAVTSVMLTPDLSGASANTQTGSAYSMTPSGATGTGGFLESNYTVNYIAYSGVVNPAQLSITATGPAKTYGIGLVAAMSTNNFSARGMVNGDQISSVMLTPDIAGGSPVTPSGAGYTVTPSAPAGNSSFNMNNYVITYIPFYGTVAVTALTITANNPNRIYGTALTPGTSTANFTAAGALPGQVVTGLTLTPDANGLAVGAAAGSTYTVQPSAPTGTGGFSAANYTVTYVPFTGIIAPRPLVVTAIAAGKVYDNTTAAAVTYGDNRIAGDVLTVNSLPAAFADKNTGTAKIVSVSGISVSGPAAANYIVNVSAVASASITPASATITAVSDSRPYTKTTSSFGVPVITGLLGSDANNTVVTQAFDNSNAGTGKTLTPAVTINDGNGGNNYTVTLVPVSTGIIRPAQVIVSATASTKIYDGTTTSGATPVINGLVGSDIASSPAVEIYDTPSVGTGKTLLVSGLVVNDGNGGGNYTIVYVSNTQGTITGATLNQAYLSNLSTSAGTLSPAFAAGTPTYTVTVVNSVNTIKVTPTASGSIGAIIVNGFAVESGSESAPISLKFGINTIVTKVIAQDGFTTNTYTLTIKRLGLSNADLVGLSLSKIVLNPGFTENVSSYYQTVDNSLFYTNVSPTLSDPTATVTVNGVPVVNGSFAPVTLYVGGNIITTLVTAQDGITQRSYTTVITRLSAPLAVQGNNIMTPNGDGVNDQWVITGILSFPNNVVTVYDRSGRIIYTKKGYDNTWGGFYRDVLLRQDTYYYTIDLGNGSKVTKGFITLLRDKN